MKFNKLAPICGLLLLASSSFAGSIIIDESTDQEGLGAIHEIIRLRDEDVEGKNRYKNPLFKEFQKYMGKFDSIQKAGTETAFSYLFRSGDQVLFTINKTETGKSDAFFYGGGRSLYKTEFKFTPSKGEYHTESPKALSPDVLSAVEAIMIVNPHEWTVYATMNSAILGLDQCDEVKVEKSDSEETFHFIKNKDIASHYEGNLRISKKPDFKNKDVFGRVEYTSELSLKKSSGPIAFY